MSELAHTVKGEINQASFNPIFHRLYDRAIYGKGDNLSWNQCVRGFFNSDQAGCMMHQFPDLNFTSYESVKDFSDVIITRVSLKNTPQGHKSSMPPGDPWPQARIDLFKQWAAEKPPKPGLQPNTGDPNTLIMDPSQTVMPDDRDYLDNSNVNIINVKSYDPKYYLDYVESEYDKTLTWNQRVRGFFTLKQAEENKKQFNLSSHQRVIEQFDDILKAGLVREDLIVYFIKWKDGGFELGDYPDPAPVNPGDPRSGPKYPDTLIMKPKP